MKRKGLVFGLISSLAALAAALAVVVALLTMTPEAEAKDFGSVQLKNLGIVYSGTVVGDEHLLAFGIKETTTTGELNSNSVLGDTVAHVYDLRCNKLYNLGLASGAIAHVDSGTHSVAFWVGEKSQGKDLNNDGDALDYILHVARIPYHRKY